MAHKTRVNGTNYEISGGKTLVNGTAYSIDKGKALVGGTAYEVGFVSIQPSEYLTFSSNSAITLSVSSPGWDGTMYYSTNATNWEEWDGGEISANTIYLCGVGNTLIAGGIDCVWILEGTGISCNGNIETLLDYVTVEAGSHPSMADYCYEYMFRGCTALTTAPSLPATTLTRYCYGYMFRGCTALTTAPSLPATTLADCCYTDMFRGCTALTTAPSLPATTLANSCYDYMFYGCTALTTAPSLPATTLAKRCYDSMFYGCTALTTASSLPATTLVESCYSSMFNGCTALTTIPRLPATTLAESCYTRMFYGCSKVKLSETQTGEYQTVYRIPTSGTGTAVVRAFNYMLGKTGGTFTSNPTINTTYYTSNKVI